MNFGFPHPFMDVIHGTYTGEWLGMRFVAERTVRLSKGDAVRAVAFGLTVLVVYVLVARHVSIAAFAQSAVAHSARAVELL